MNVASGALGAYFSYHLFQLLKEQYESVKENQSFIDDLKNQYGEPNDIWSGMKMSRSIQHQRQHQTPTS